MQQQRPQERTAPAKSKGLTAPPEFQTGEIEKLDAAGLTRILNDPSASEFQKAKACQMIAQRGDASAIPAVAKLLADPRLSHYARYALEPMPGAAADDALRAAITSLKGDLLIGVINSIGFRKDEKAIMPLSRLIHGTDPRVADAAAAAVAQISGPDASRALQSALTRTKDPVKTYVARAALQCAENLMNKGSRNEALALYQVLTATSMPKPVRLGAMHAIISAETSLTRPRPAAPAAPGA